jgi:3-hydroxyisobutyrate dehydrogenase
MAYGMDAVGVIGVGRMGLPVCATLVRNGFTVTAGDVRPEARKAVLACGARWGGTGAAVAAASDVVITMLPGTGELRDLMLGPGGLLAALPPGRTWIDMTSASPTAGKALAGAALARGIGMLEAPAGGGPRAAAAGRLQLFVGGDSVLLERHRVLLEAVADPARITHMGGAGAGYTAKLLVNLLWFGQAVATAEALILARREGIDLEVLQEALAGSAAASSFIAHDVSALLSGDYLTTFGLDRCCEELAAVTALAREAGVPFGLSEHIEQVYRRALVWYGPADGELLPVAMMEEQAGVNLRRRPS